MDSVLPNFVPEPSSPKHSHFVAILSVFVVVVLAFLAYVIYLYVNTPAMVKVVQQNIPLSEQRVTLTPDQIAEKHKILEQIDTSRVKLTPAQIQAKALQIKQAQQTEI